MQLSGVRSSVRPSVPSTVGPAARRYRLTDCCDCCTAGGPAVSSSRAAARRAAANAGSATLSADVWEAELVLLCMAAGSAGVSGEIDDDDESYDDDYDELIDVSKPDKPGVQ